MVASRVQLRWRHSPLVVVCEAWAWEVYVPRPLRRTTPTYNRRPSMSWLTNWHRLAAVCWMSCDVCLICRSDVNYVWRRYFGSRVFHVSWTFVRPQDIVARDTLSWFPYSHIQFIVTCSFICRPWGFLVRPKAIACGADLSFAGIYFFFFSPRNLRAQWADRREILHDPSEYVQFYNPKPKFWRSLPKKFLEAKNMQNLARCRSTLKFGGQFLWNG